MLALFAGWPEALSDHILLEERRCLELWRSRLGGHQQRRTFLSRLSSSCTIGCRSRYQKVKLEVAGDETTRRVVRKCLQYEPDNRPSFEDLAIVFEQPQHPLDQRSKTFSRVLASKQLKCFESIPHLINKRNEAWRFI
jgi:hypothetical protein